MPWLDWQFYIVTMAAIWGAWTVLRQLLPSAGPTGPACGACASGACACAKKPQAQASTPGAPLVVLGDRRRDDATASREA